MADESKAKADETTPLIDAPKEAPKTGRLSREMSKPLNLSTEGAFPKTYDVDKVASYRVFGMWSGTIFEEKSLWMETGALAVVYISVFLLVHTVKWDGFKDFVGKEENIHALMGVFCTLIGLLLSFYTALNLGRWWQMRMKVHEIEGACSRLMLLLSQTTTSDEELLLAVQRYSRASLFLVFAASQEYDVRSAKLEEPLREAEKRGLLRRDERHQLEKMNKDNPFVSAEVLWVWMANMINQLHHQGLTLGPPHTCQLLYTVELGRNGVAEIQTYLGTQIPLGYVHLLCMMVKLHNFLLNILQALISVSLLGGGTLVDTTKGTEVVPLFRSAFRAWFMPFLYNSILILNTGVSDPFGGDACDFNFSDFDKGIEDRSYAFMDANKNLPDVLKDGGKKYEAAPVGDGASKAV